MPRVRRSGMSTIDAMEDRAAKVATGVEEAVLPDDDPVDLLAHEKAVFKTIKNLKRLKDENTINNLIKKIIPSASILGKLQTPELKYFTKHLEGARKGNVENYKKVKALSKDIKERFEKKEVF